MAGKSLKNGFLDTTFALMPFFGMGYITKQCTNILYPQKWDRWLLLIVIACLFITYLIGGRCAYMHDYYRISPLAQYIGGMAGTLGVVFLSKYLGTLPFLSYWGRYSLMILCTHALLLQIYVPFVRKIHLPVGAAVLVLLVATMFSYQLLIPLMKKYLPYVTAQKDVIRIKKTNTNTK
jgi:fucose 4-O-acetylase-like acetyltransferase